MRRFILTIAAAVLICVPAVADLRIIETTRTDKSLIGLTTSSSKGPIQEMWVGAGRAALTQAGHTYILDLTQDRFWFVNHANGTYVESSLPLDLTELLAADLLARRKIRWASGSVRSSGGFRDILGRRCKEFEVELWNVNGTGRSDQQKLTVWASEEVSHDEAALSELLVNMRMIHNRDGRLRKELAKIRGVQMRTEYLTDSGIAWDSRFVSEVIEMTEEDPPPGTYTPPEHYKNKPKLTSADF